LFYLIHHIDLFFYFYPKKSIKYFLEHYNEGYHNYLGSRQWKLCEGSLILDRRKKMNTLYKTEARLVKGDINVVENETSTELWHKRLGHISEKGLQVFAKK